VATQAQTGSVPATLMKLAASMSGEQLLTGTGAVVLSKVAASLTGGQDIPGIMGFVARPAAIALLEGVTLGQQASTLPKVVASLTGLHVIDGVEAVTIKKLAASLNGTQEFTGALQSSLIKTAVGLVGDQPFTGVQGSLLRPLAVALTGGQEYTGAENIALKKVYVSLSGSTFFPAVVREATGTGVEQIGTGATRTVTVVVVVPSGLTNAYIVIGATTSHDGWLTSYSTFSASSDNSGTITAQTMAIGFPSSQEQCAARFFTMPSPGVGTHNILVTFTPGSFNANVLRAQAAVYSGVASLSGHATSRNNGSVLSVNLASGTNDMGLIVGAFGGNPGTFNSTALYQTGAAQTGTGDYTIMGERIGESDNSINFGVANNVGHCEAVLNLEAA